MSYIYKKLTQSDFIQAFNHANREDNFSVAGLEALFNYYEELGEDTGKPFELDVRAICCDWTEYDQDELINQYDHLLDSATDEYDCEEQLLSDLVDELESRTYVIELGKGCYLVQCF